MADKVYPSAKPNTHPPQDPNGGAANGRGGPPSFPATKAQLYGATRPAYRPQAPPKRRRSRRGRCCTCCLWFTFIIVALILLAAIAGGIFYVIYRPHRPTFSVSSLHLSNLNLTKANVLTSKLDIAVTARNPNRKLVFLYDPTSIAVYSNGVDIGDGSFPAFVQEAKNTTILRATMSTSGQSLDASAASDLKKSSIPLEIQLETKAGVKVGSLKTKRIGIRVTCDGISVAVPKGKAAAAAAATTSPDSSCKVKLRFKIWKWMV